MKKLKKISSLLLAVVFAFCTFISISSTVNANDNAVVYVEDAKCKHYEYIDYNNCNVNVTYRLPKILIDGNDANVANNEIINNAIHSIILFLSNNRAGMAIIQDNNPTLKVQRIHFAISGIL